MQILPKTRLFSFCRRDSFYLRGTFLWINVLSKIPLLWTLLLLNLPFNFLLTVHNKD